MANPKKSRLGRGLDHLITQGASHIAKDEGDPDEGNTKRSAVEGIEKKQKQSDYFPDLKKGIDSPALSDVAGVRELALACIIPNVRQARHRFDEKTIRELADSIKKEGLLQPIIVRPVDEHYFTIVAGERRFRAAQSLGLATILARVIHASEQDCDILSLIENLQRESLNPIEEALGFAHLIETYGLTQEQIAQRVGKARATIANSLRLLNLEQEILHYLETEQITVGHAKVLLGIDETALRMKLLEKILAGDLNVRQTERQANLLRQGNSLSIPSTPKELSASLMKIEKQMARQLAANVSLQHGPKHGRIVIEYDGEQELLRIIQSMGIEGC